MHTLKYKGYIFRIEYSEEDKEFSGTVLNLKEDRICFGGKTPDELKKNMEQAVQGHIENCKSLGIKPEKPINR